jgi:hypothetical protein
MGGGRGDKNESRPALGGVACKKLRAGIPESQPFWGSMLQSRVRPTAFIGKLRSPDYAGYLFNQ